MSNRPLTRSQTAERVNPISAALLEEHGAERTTHDHASEQPVVVGRSQGARGVVMNAEGARGAAVNAEGARGAAVNAEGARGAVVNAEGARGAVVNAEGARGAVVNTEPSELIRAMEAFANRVSQDLRDGFDRMEAGFDRFGRDFNRDFRANYEKANHDLGIQITNGVTDVLRPLLLDSQTSNSQISGMCKRVEQTAGDFMESSARLMAAMEGRPYRDPVKGKEPVNSSSRLPFSSTATRSNPLFSPAAQSGRITILQRPTVPELSTPIQHDAPHNMAENVMRALEGTERPVLNPIPMPSTNQALPETPSQVLSVIQGESHAGTSNQNSGGNVVQSVAQPTIASAGGVIPLAPIASGFHAPNVIDLTGSSTRSGSQVPIQFGQIDSSYGGGQHGAAPNVYAGGQHGAPNFNAGSQVPQPVYPGGCGVQQPAFGQPMMHDPTVVGYMPPPPLGPVEIQQTTRDQILETFQQLGFDVGRVSRTRYRAPYPEWVDRCHLYPRGYKVPEFILFSGDNNASTIEHVARFTTQCGEAASNTYLKLRLFANSLTKTAFDWYISLAPDSIHTWEQMEQAFHDQFYRCEPETMLADLASIKQGTTESVEKYMSRFKIMRNKCRIALPEKECVHMLLMGMSFHLKKKLDTQTFLDVSHLQTQAMRAEMNKQEKDRRKTASRGTYSRNQAVAFADVQSQSSDSSEDDGPVDVAVAEMVLDKPFVCPALSKAKDDKQRPKKRDGEKVFEDRRKYSFDITKAEEIFDLMLKEKVITLKGEHVIPAKDELDGKKYCKWHNSWSHDTGNCIVLRNKIEKAVTSGMLRFPEGKMKIDEDPFLRMDARVADVKRVTGPRAESSHEGQPSTSTSMKALESSKVRNAILRTCPKCLEDYEEEDLDAEMRFWKNALGDGSEPQEREVQVHADLDGSERVIVTVKFAPSALKTFKPKPKPNGEWTHYEPKKPKVSVHDRMVFKRASVHDRLGPRIPAQANKGRVNFPEGLTKTQKRRLQRLKSQARRGEEEQRVIKTDTRMKRVWVPKVKREQETHPTTGKAESGSRGMDDADQNGGSFVPPDDEPGVLDDLDNVDDLDDEEDADYLMEDALYYDEANMVFVLPEEFRAKDDQPEQLKDDVLFIDDEEEASFNFTTDIIDASNIQETLAGDKGAIVLRRPDPNLKRHIKPLYITAHMDGIPISRVLIDGGAGMNIMPLKMMKHLGRSVDELIPKNVVMVGFTGDETEQLGVLPVQLKVGSVVKEAAFFVMNIKPSYAALLGRDWIHRNDCIPSTLHQYLIMWKPNGEVDVVPSDEDPFEGQTYSMEARYYDGSVGPMRLEMRDAEGRPTRCLLSMKPEMARTIREMIPGPYGIEMGEPFIEELDG